MATNVEAKEYDVFLSFRGDDTRTGITDHIYRALDDKGIKTFRDTENLERGEQISPALLKAIEDSRFAVVVFSQRYAGSTWCLEELAKIAECCEGSAAGLTALPLFYHVDPSNLRKQTEKTLVGAAFASHEERFKDDVGKVDRWRKALTQIASISGWDFKDRFELDVIQDLVQHILRKLEESCHSKPSSALKEGYLVGLDSRVEKLVSCLNRSGSEEEVRVVGMWGARGVGKTTIANEAFERIRGDFPCSMLIGAKEFEKHDQDLTGLQKHLYKELLGIEPNSMQTVSLGKKILRQRLCSKKVLLILDGVRNLEQIETLVGSVHQIGDRFGRGSRIIIASHMMDLLMSYGCDEVYKVEELTEEESLELFCLKVFNQDRPSSGYEELAGRFRDYASGLPLALTVLGDLMRPIKSTEQWRAKLDHLKKNANKSINDCLQLSYDSLDVDDHKKMFLDLACFFKGEDESRVKAIFKSCDFDPENGLDNLVNKSLVTREGGKLWMHDLIQQLGWEIVRKEKDQVKKRSRLWHHDDALHFLKENMGPANIQGLFLTPPGMEEIAGNPFLNMKELRLLKICNVNFSGCREYYLSKKLRLFEWHGFPLNIIASSFESERLVELSMPNSNIEQLWRQTRRLEHLILINLNNCQYLTKTPDFSFVPNLKSLILEGCKSLTEVHPSIGGLVHLVLLNLKGCERLQKLCQRISLRSLETLILFECSNLKEFPEIEGDMNNLSELYLDRTDLRKLPGSINRLSGLTSLSVSGCKKLLSIPSGILCGLKSLKQLVFTGCSSMDQLPEDLGKLENLEKLLVDETAIKKLPPSILLLKNLKVLSLRRCGRGDAQHKSWNFGFKIFGAGHSDESDSNGFELPNDIGRLSSLQYLDLSENSFRTLPQSISQLSRLKALYLMKCSKLESLPKHLPSLSYLDVTDCPLLQKDSSNKQLEVFVTDEGFQLIHYGDSSSTRTLDEEGTLENIPLPMPIDHADQVFATYIKGLINEGKNFELRFPHDDKVPNWGTNWSKRSKIKIKLASAEHEDQLRMRIMKGFAIFVGFAIKKHECANFVEGWESKEIFCQFYIDKNRFPTSFVFRKFENFRPGSFGLCSYIPVEWFAGWLSISSQTIEALVSTERLDLEIRQVGMHQIFEQDVEDFCKKLSETANEHDPELNFARHCNKLLDGANKLECSGDIMTIESSHSSLTALKEPPNEAEDDDSIAGLDSMISTSIYDKQNFISIHSLLSILFQGHYARHNILHFIIPFRIFSPWFFHHSVGNIAVCYLPFNLCCDKTWVGLELYVVCNRRPLSSISYLASEVVLVDLYAHQCSTSQPIFSHQLEINIGPNFVVCHVPRKYFPRELNQFEVISVFFRPTNPDVEVEMCGTRLLYEQDSIILSKALIAAAGQTLEFLCYQAILHGEAMQEFLRSRCESDDNDDGDDQCSTSIEANQETPQSTCTSSSESREWNYTSIIKSLQKLLSSTDREAANHGAQSTSLSKIRMYYSVKEAVEGSDGVLFHSKRSALENLDRNQESDENASRDLPATIRHLHIIGETLLCSNESEKQIKERCIALLRDILEHCVLTTLSLRGHTVFASKGFDPACPYNLCFPQKEIPEWFDHYQCRGYMVGIELPPNLGDDSSWRGLVICASFSIYEHPGTFSKESFRLLCHLTSGGSCLNPVPQSLFTKDKIKWLHLRGFIWLTYIPRVFLMELNGKDIVEARVYNYCPGLVVKECGIRLLYQPDVERLRQMIIQCCTSFVENLDPIYQFLEAEDDD